MLDTGVLARFPDAGREVVGAHFDASLGVDCRMLRGRVRRRRSSEIACGGSRGRPLRAVVCVDALLTVAGSS